MYTERQLYDALVQIAIINHMKWWPWDSVFGPRPADERAAFWKELQKYSWVVYQKALTASGDAYIGRMDDLRDLKRKVCNIDTRAGRTLFDEGAKGNVLEMNKWAPVLNDAWVLGGVHRHADFVLHSPRSLQNLWEDSQNRTGLVVTAREISGLKAFGYEQVTVTGDNVRYVCRDKGKAARADLLSFNRLAKEMEAQGSSSILGLLGIREDVAKQIRSFDPRTLRPAPKK